MKIRSQFGWAALAALLMIPSAWAQGSAAAPEKIGILNMQIAITSTAEGKQASSELQAQFAPRQAELETTRKQIEDIQTRLRNGASTLSDEEKQRLVGVLPNFYTSYVPDAAPLTWKQKFALATRGTFDPVALLGVGFAAGIEQANNSFAGYGQGGAGYGKRFAAKFADGRSSDYLTHAIFPTLLHQDPRYYYQGTGSFKSRLLHAVGSAFLTRSDSGRTEPNYSYVLGDMCSGALSNLYYPAANRGAHLVFSTAAVGLAGRVGGNILREFLPKHSTTNVPREGTP